MCGIVGVINHAPGVNMPICRLFDEALWVDQIRGNDGTGIMCLDNTDKVRVLKAEGGYLSLYSKKDYHGIQNWADQHYFSVGHNRAATRGSKNEHNAHPFQEGDVSLVHNGTLTWYDPEYKAEAWKDDVDSRALTKIINDLGIVKGVDKFSGAYAIAWIDKEKKQLNLARNKERPLGFVKLENYTLFASEPNMMAWLASRQGLKVLEIGVYEENKLYTYDKEAREPIVTDLPEPKVFTQPIHTMFPVGGRIISGGTDRISGKSKNKERTKACLILAVSDTINLAIGDRVKFNIEYAKVAPQGSFSSFQAQLCEPAFSGRHQIHGNVAMPVSELLNSNRSILDRPVFSGKITYLGKSNTGFSLLQVSDVIKLPKSNVIALPPPKDYKNYAGETVATHMACSLCNTVVHKSDIRTWKRYMDKNRAENNYVKAELCVDCFNAAICDDSSLQQLFEDIGGNS
jgi:hypothetical protein